MANAEVVLIISLSLVFFYLVLFAVSAFSEFNEKRQLDREETYLGIQEDIIKKLENLQIVVEAATSFVYIIGDIIST